MGWRRLEDLGLGEREGKEAAFLAGRHVCGEGHGSSVSN